MAPPGIPLIGDPGQLIHRSPDGRLEIRRTIMSTFPAEAIVNATDYLMTINTANVPDASFQITNAAGPDLLNHLKHNYPRGLRVGDALASPSYELTNCYRIIHVNGPNYRTRISRLVPLLKQQLADCYRRCLEEAFKLGVNSVAFPCISTGSILGWPRTEAARIGVRTVRAWLRHPIHGVKRMGVIGRVSFLADPVGAQAHQEQAWCEAFREIWPQALTPRRPPRASPQEWHLKRRNLVRQRASIGQAVETRRSIENHPVITASEITSPLNFATDATVMKRELRRSRRVRKPPQRYGQ